MSDIDLIEELIGRFGKYQSWMLCLTSFGLLTTVFQLANVLFILPDVDYVCKDLDAYNLTNHCPCKVMEYDRTVIYESATSEWNLVCERTALASLAQSLLQVGMLTGSLLFGYLSDRFGRKTSVLLSFLSLPVFIMMSAFVPSFWIFASFRFLSGCACGGALLTSFVFMVELSGKSFRAYLLGLLEIPFVIGEMMLAVIAYYVRDWRNLQLVTSVPWLTVILFYWILPESPRWLITVGRKDEAIEILTNIAKKNNRAVDRVIDIVNEIEKESLQQDQKKQGSYLDLFKTPKVRMYTIINALIWMCCAHSYFGINQYIGRLQGNLYLNAFVSALLLIPALPILVISAVNLKRKTNAVVTFVIAAMSCLLHVFISEDSQTAAFAVAMMGRLGIYASFCLVYLFTAELFPTIIRNSAVGFASMCGRLGAFLAPFVVNLGIKWESMSIFSAVSFCAAFLCCFLPETKDIVLHNSIEQTERSDKK